MPTQSAKKSLNLVDPETASQPIKDALALLPLINVFRAMANAETHSIHTSASTCCSCSGRWSSTKRWNE
jgi:hypothetical protein